MARIPRQERSKAMTQAIVTAGFICVSKRGMAATTTHHIAELAGVSVGSLYEYFANKEAVFEAMTQQMLQELVALITDMTPRIIHMTVDEGIDHVLECFTDFLNKENGFYLNAAKHILSSDAGQYMELPGKAIMDMIYRYLMTHPEYAKLPELNAVIYIITYGGISVVIRNLSSEAPYITYDELQRGIHAFVSSYFKGIAPS